VIVARESELFVNGAAEGIAIPKARSPIVCPDTPAMVMLWWCGQRAIVIDEAPTKVLFLIVAPTIKQHLQLVSRLSLALYDADLRTAVQRNGAFDQVVAQARRWEQEIEAAPPNLAAAR